MIIIRNQLKFIALLSLFTLSTTIALGQGAHKCEKYWNASRVFIGMVERIQRGKSEVYEYRDGVKQYSNIPVLHVSFRVKSTFNGRKSFSVGTLVEVECADCLKQNRVLPGRSYLVYAHGAGLKGSGPLATDRPELISRMTREISYLKRLTAPGTIASALNGVASGLLSGSARYMPTPAYPDLAKAARVSGSVIVAVVLDPSGKVIRAEAVCGHPLLRATSVAAASLITYKPTKVNGKPIPVGGIVVYNFLPQ